MGGIPSVYSDNMLKRLNELIAEKKPAWAIGNEIDELGLKSL
jgi:hypothetical protein